MKKIVLLLAATLVNQVFAEQLPHRQPGLWELEVSLPGQPIVQKIKECVDSKTDSKTLGLNPDMPCSSQELSRNGDRYIMEAECTLMNSKANIRIVTSGDFKTSYAMEIVSKFDPPLGGQSESRQTIKGRWLGPCSKGQKPGEVIMEDGTKINLIGTETTQ